MQANEIILSVPTSGSGATAAATFSFFTSGYQVPRQGRSISADTVHNHNGIFTYVYDNGPNIRTWQPFEIVCSDKFLNYLGAATQQHSRFEFLWNYTEGSITLQAPEGVYAVRWSDQPLERRFARFPSAVGDKIEYRYQVNFEEGG